MMTGQPTKHLSLDPAAANQVGPADRLPDRDFPSPVLQRLTYFWLALIIAALISGGVGANAHQHDLWRSWRGPVMVTLCVVFAAWYLWWLWLTNALQKKEINPRLLRSARYVWVGSGFLIGTGLLLLDSNFVGVAFALMGCSFVIPSRQALIPITLAILLAAWGEGVLPPARGQSLGDLSGNLYGLALGVGITLAFSALARERYIREHLFRELSQAHRQLRLAAAREVDLATLRERNRLAREMHDSLGHALVSITIKLEAARLLNAVDTARANAELEEVTALVRSTMTDLRHSLAGLRPAILEERPLSVALGELAHEMGRRTGAMVACLVDDHAAPDRCLQETLFRIGQEALTNVAKHARAQQVTLSLTKREDAVVLEVQDDGIGMGAARNGSAPRFGVQGMRERVEAAGGMLTLGPGPIGGTILRAWIPMVAQP